MKKIIVAGGCFWGVQAYFDKVKGVETTRVGYGNGIEENPSYEDVCTGETFHAEVCEIVYNDEIISLEQILELFFRIIDPTSLNKQGGDIGTQYRTGIYLTDESDRVVIENYIENEQKKHKNKIVVEIDNLKCFYDAEEYHQKYLIKNPRGYCHINMGLLKPEEKK